MPTQTPTTYIDPRQESVLLNKYGLKYAERRIPTTEIDFEHSIHLNGRMETRANQDKIVEYAVKKLDGEVFPFVVLSWDASRAAYLIWSGVHRVGADREIKAPTVMAFVVDVNPAGNTTTLTKLRAFAAESNVRHGYATSAAERLHAACDQYEAGADIDEVAARFGMTPQDIRKGVHERKLNFELRQRGLRPEAILRVSDKEAILRAPDEGVMRDVANFVIRNTTVGKDQKQKVNVSQGEVTTLVRQLIKEKSPKERANLIAAADAVAKQGKKKNPNRATMKDPRKSPTFVWRGCVVRLTGEFDERALVKASPTGDELEQILLDVKAVRTVCDAVERAVERAL